MVAVCVAGKKLYDHFKPEALDDEDEDDFSFLDECEYDFGDDLEDTEDPTPILKPRHSKEWENAQAEINSAKESINNFSKEFDKEFEEKKEEIEATKKEVESEAKKIKEKIEDAKEKIQAGTEDASINSDIH